MKKILLLLIAVVVMSGCGVKKDAPFTNDEIVQMTDCAAKGGQLDIGIGKPDEYSIDSRIIECFFGASIPQAVKIPLPQSSFCFWDNKTCGKFPTELKEVSLQETLQLIIDTEGYKYQPSETETKPAKLVK